jgi:NTE family protein
MNGRALVLGGGGVTGIAWETGVLMGLRDGGFDVDHWDLVIGSSAGALVATRLLGSDLREFYDEQASNDYTAEDDRVRLLAGRIGGWMFFAGRRRRLEWLPRMWAASVVARALLTRTLRRRLRGRVRRPVVPPSPFARGAPDADLARLGVFARSAKTASEAAFLEVITAGILPVADWPDPLLVTAIDSHDGSLVGFDKATGVPLPLAVAASAAVPGIFPPVRIDGRRYVDGGTASDTNAHLADGHRDVVVIAPLDRGYLQGEVEQLERGGSRVTIVRPSFTADVLLGRHLALLDPARRAGCARGGYDDGVAEAARLVETSAA